MRALTKAWNKVKSVFNSAKTRVIAYVSAPVLFVATNAHAALDPAVDTSITAAQSDVLAMIAKGFAYLGAVVGAMVVLSVFVKILRKGKG
jgi:hypothetical protein